MNARAEGDSDGDSEPDIEQLRFKVVLLGDGTVGKTSLLRRFCEEQFGREYKQTIGLDFFTKQVVLPGGKRVSLQIWDIGGQSLGSSMLGNYIFGADAAVLVYDTTNYPSFQDLQDWLAIVHQTFPQASRAPALVVAANKADLVHLRAVSQTRHGEFCAAAGASGHVVSALTGEGVNTLFTSLAATLAGVQLTGPQLDVAAPVVKAEIVNHQQNDPNQKPIDLTGKNGKCAIQ